MLAGAPVDGIGLDLTRDGARNLDLLAAAGGIGDRTLVAGVVDGRNVWVNDLERSLSTLATLLGLAGEVVVSTSCSLQHVPIDLDAEQALDPEIRPWLAFARQKVAEVVTLARGLAEGTGAIAEELEANQRTLAGRRRSGRTHDPAVRRRLDAIGEPELRRASPYEVREKAQRARLGLPPLPTTTIGSFPQTGEVRKARAARRRGELDEAGYQARMRDEIAEVIRIQDELELDVLVHGEPERNDMVQYFGEQLDGVAVTELGWVQSYGTRYVRPPVIFGDVARPAPMTVVAHLRPVAHPAAGQGHADRSGDHAEVVVRARRPAAGGDRAPARPGHPGRDGRPGGGRDRRHPGRRAGPARGPALRRDRRDAYLAWAVEAFRLATAGVRDETQVHTHMCYSEFGEILPAIDGLDADVTSIEAARSRMELGPRPGAGRVRARDRPRGLRHPLAAGAAARRDGHAAGGGPGGGRPDPALGQPRLRPQDPRLPEVLASLRNMVAAARTVREGLG